MTAWLSTDDLNFNIKNQSENLINDFLSFYLKKTALPVIGVEICEQAVEDARHNAAINGMVL